MIKEANKYEEWLTTIANARVIYNTMEELENMLDNHAIHSNGMKRCFGSPQKLRAVFRDLKVEVMLMTDENVSLDNFMEEYRTAWCFYRSNLSRRTNPEKTAMEILRYCHYPYARTGYGERRAAVYRRIVEQNLNVPILIMLVMKALPGYESKEGDAVNMAQSYETVMSLLETYTCGGTMFSMLPAITVARGEENKSRVMLYHHICKILSVFESYVNDASMYETTSSTKALVLNLELDGFWNECSGTLGYTRFWQIEKALNDGAYFVTCWRKDAENKLTGIKYVWLLHVGPDGNLAIHVMHPEAIKHRIKGIALSDADMMWYRAEMPLDDEPESLPLHRIMASDMWPSDILLTRVRDESVAGTYSKWMRTCKMELAYSDYTFYQGLFAITEDSLYISTETDGEFFKVPKDCHDGLEKIQFGDYAGIMQMNDKAYIAFDELMLYISTSRYSLQKYGIKRVRRIE